MNSSLTDWLEDDTAPDPVVGTSLFGKDLHADDVHEHRITDTLAIVKEHQGATPLDAKALTDPYDLDLATDPSPPMPRQRPQMPSGATFIPEEGDRLLQQLAESDETWAGGAAWYGPFGLYDNKRKALLSVLKMQIRDQYVPPIDEVTKKPVRLTDGMADDMAHAHPDYVAFLDTHITEKALWLVLDQQREQIKMQIKHLTYARMDR